MNEESYVDSDEIEEMPDESGSGILEMLEQMQQQLTFLEKKIDLLINRTKEERSFDNARPAPRPFRKPYDKPAQRFERPPRRDRGDREDRERGFGDRERSFGDRERGYGDRERGYGDRDSSRDHNFERRGKPGKKPGGKPRPGSGKKPFYSRFKD